MIDFLKNLLAEKSWTRIFGLTLGVMLILSMFFYRFRDDSPEGYQKAIEVFEGRKEVDKLCETLPRPDGTKLLSRSIEGSTQRFAVGFDFETTLQMNPVRDFYKQWFESNGWVRNLDSSLAFEKGGRRVALEFTSVHKYSMNCSASVQIGMIRAIYPAAWFAPINDPNKSDWEILPQERHAGEVILSKRNDLGILSNFAATPFER